MDLSSLKVPKTSKAGVVKLSEAVSTHSCLHNEWGKTAPQPPHHIKATLTYIYLMLDFMMGNLLAADSWLEMCQLDVKTALLNSRLKEQVYVLHGESSNRLATPRNTKDKKHLQSTQSAQPTNHTDQAPSTTERTAWETHNPN